MFHKRIRCRTGGVFALLSLWVPGAPAADIQFNRDIRPILSDKCFLCHGPDSASRKADLRLDLEEQAKAALKDGTRFAIQPGHPEQSEIIHRIFETDPDEIMPPTKSKLILSADEKETLKTWVSQGASWEGHWAFIPPKAVAPPAIDDPWIRNDIDRFVLDRLRREGLEPAPEADLRMLLRRITFGLIGLPPDAKALSATESYEAAIERLLRSERYGERMATDWLDLARYADSYGFQQDRNRFVWPWRDWVIQSFNRNQAYDEFVTWQLAGDLLPNPTDEQLLATTFCRLNQQKVEGGSVEEEFRVEYVADRTHTFGTAFLGLTLECARCHDHKYDPITARDYYSFFAYFNNIDEAGLYSFFTQAVPTPTLAMTDDRQQAKWATLKEAVAKSEEELAQVREAAKTDFDRWLKGDLPDAFIPGLLAHVSFDEDKPGPHTNAADEKILAKSGGSNTTVKGKHGKGLKLSGDDAVTIETGAFGRDDAFSISLWMQTPEDKERAVIFHRSRAWTDSGSQGYQLLLEDGKLSASLIHFWPGNAIRIRSREKLPLNSWQQVTMTYRGNSQAAGLTLYLNGQALACEVVRDHLTKGIEAGGVKQFAIGERFRDRGFAQGQIDELVIVDRCLSPLEVQHLYDGQRLQEAIDQREDALFDWYLAVTNSTWQAAAKALQAKVVEQNKLEEGFTEIMVMRERPEPRQAYVLHRGQYTERREAVNPQPPAWLPAGASGLPANRLGLAQWLTDPAHPLTARVAVNRYWQMHFGQGLVKTTEDFGSQGSRPSHPELLDWLALRFIASGWDLKALHQLILQSATYRQSAHPDPEKDQRDPENDWLARGPKMRLPAEMLRDQALAASGLLVNKIGGAPAKPYDLKESFKPMDYDKNENLYRRSVYTYWKLTGPSPVMMSLNAVKRDTCTVKREPTSTPLQALVLLNGPQFVEASRVMAESLIREYADDPDLRIQEAFRRLTGLQPSDDQVRLLREMVDEQVSHFQINEEAARQLTRVGERKPDERLDPVLVAATTSLINLLMNFDGSVVLR
jgi:hypothetical protein